MLLTNIRYYGSDRKFHEGEIRITAGRIAEVMERPVRENILDPVSAAEGGEQPEGIAADGLEIVDGEGAYCIPGLIDMHFHGCMGADFSDGTFEALDTISDYEITVGVTAIAPAAMTLPEEKLVQILENAAEFRVRQAMSVDGLAGFTETAEGSRPRGADLLGVQFEGPFISRAKTAAQDPRNIRPLDIALAERFIDAGKGLLKVMGTAPETASPEEAEAFCRALRNKVVLSLTHTNADYDTAMAAIRNGVCHATHLFNAMPPFHHRDPGVVGAVFDSPDVTAELICDGIHIHPAVIRTVFRELGADRVILISDSTRATGMKDGKYDLGGLAVEKRGNQVRLAEGEGKTDDGTFGTPFHMRQLAGSATNLWDCMKYTVQTAGIPLEDAVRAASENPAKRLGVFAERGSIAPGKFADLVLMDENLTRKMILKRGVAQEVRNDRNI